MAIQQYASGIFGRAQRLADRVISPDTRKQFYGNVSTFANDQPLLATFLAIQLVLSFTPIAIFSSFVLGTLLLSLISAALFSLFWIGVALLILVPTLFITVSLGVLVWIWALSTFIIARWIYQITPLSLRGKAELEMPNGKKVVVNKAADGQEI